MITADRPRPLAPHQGVGRRAEPGAGRHGVEARSCRRSRRSSRAASATSRSRTASRARSCRSSSTGRSVSRSSSRGGSGFFSGAAIGVPHLVPRRGVPSVPQAGDQLGPRRRRRARPAGAGAPSSAVGDGRSTNPQDAVLGMLSAIERLGARGPIHRLVVVGPDSDLERSKLVLALGCAIARNFDQPVALIDADLENGSASPSSSARPTSPAWPSASPVSSGSTRRCSASRTATPRSCSTAWCRPRA